MRVGGFLIGVLTATAVLSVVLDVPELTGMRNIVSGLAERTVALSREAVRGDLADSGADLEAGAVAFGPLPAQPRGDAGESQPAPERSAQRVAEPQPERARSLPNTTLNEQAVARDVGRSEGGEFAEPGEPVTHVSQRSEKQTQSNAEVTDEPENYAADVELPALPVEERTPGPPAPAFPDATDSEVRGAALLADVEASEPHWQIFWSPFRSTRSATGFAERLATVTGLEITVLEERRGRHYVAFAYGDELQRGARYALIERSTGLRITRQGR